MKTIAIAMMCHAINAAYCQSMGDDSQTAWDDAPDWQKQSAIAGVEMHLANPDATPEQSHENWYKQKEVEGWKYGEVKDAEKKEHPCFLPYEQLPPEQKAKDYLFRTVVHMVKDLPDPEDYLALSAEMINLRQKIEQQKNVAIDTATVTPNVSVQQKSIGVVIQYVGSKSLFTDHLYNSALTFTQGQVRSLPSDLAAKFLKHPEFKHFVEQDTQEQPQDDDLKQVDDTKHLLDQAKATEQKKVDEQTHVLDEIDVVNRMTKESLSQYALEKYQQKLNPALKVGELREQVTKMIYQFGIV